MQLLVVVAAVGVTACGYEVDDCKPPPQSFAFDEALDEELVARLVLDSRVLDHTQLECKLVCELIYVNRHPKGATTEMERCTLTIDGDFTGDPEAVVGSLVCEGLGVPEFCVDP